MAIEIFKGKGKEKEKEKESESEMESESGSISISKLNANMNVNAGATVLTDLDLMRSLLRRQGIDLEEERARQAEAKMLEEKRQRVAAEGIASRAFEAAEISKTLAELVKSGHIRIRLDEKPIKSIEDYRCPTCGGVLPRLDVMNHYAETYWRGGNSHLEGFPALVINRRGFAEAQVDCPSCKKKVYVTIQCVL